METAHQTIMLEEFLAKYAGKKRIKFRGANTRPLHLVLEIDGRLYRVRIV